MEKKTKKKLNAKASKEARTGGLSGQDISEGAKLLKRRSKDPSYQPVEEDDRLTFRGGIVSFAKREPVTLILSSAIILLIAAWFILFD